MRKVKPFTEEDEYALLNELAINTVTQFKRSFKSLKGKQFTDSYMNLLKRLNELNARLSEKSGARLFISSQNEDQGRGTPIKGIRPDL